MSRLFSAYYLQKHPEQWVGITSYTAKLAYSLSGDARDNYMQGGGQLRGDAHAVTLWKTTEGGGFWAAGFGGSITGLGYHLGIIDDPLKGHEEAASTNIRDKQRDWYQSVFSSRKEPGAGIVIIQTRWHADDLSGWLLADEETAPDGWYVMSLPAIAEPLPELPATCTAHPDWRAEGEPLCPERYDRDWLAKEKRKVGEYHWGALYQQRPTPRSGAFFRTAQMEIADAAPPIVRKVRSWDLAAVRGAGDYTAGVLMGIDGRGQLWILDVIRGQFAPHERNALMKQTAVTDGKETLITLPQDPGQAGLDQAQQLTRMLRGFRVRSACISGSKDLRAEPLAAQVNVGAVSMVKAAWNRDLLTEFDTFPLGSHDDQVDAAADAFAALVRGGGGKGMSGGGGTMAGGVWEL